MGDLRSQGYTTVLGPHPPRPWGEVPAWVCAARLAKFLFFSGTIAVALLAGKPAKLSEYVAMA